MAETKLCAAAEPEWAAFIGIDWADRKHDWIEQQRGQAGKPRTGQFAQTPEAIDSWAAELGERFDGRPVAVALEQSRGALLFQLLKYPHLVLFPIHPNTVAQYRKGFRPSGTKSDAIDRAVLLDLLMRHRDQLCPLQPDTVETRTIQFLTEQRRNWVNHRTSFGQQLTATLKLYYPQVLDWFDDLTAPIVLDWLERWPTLEKLQRAKPATIEQFLIEHGRRDAETIQRQLDKIEQARPAVTDQAVIASCLLHVTALLGQLKPLRASIAEYDRALESLVCAHPDFAIVDSFPGMGPAMAPRVIAALGTQRDRFADASALQRFTGIAPILHQSGAQRMVHWRRACPKFIRQTMHEWAFHSMKSCEWARGFYDQQRQAGKGHHAAIRSLAFKWLRILFRCWKDRVPYDETRYLRAVRDRLLPKVVLKKMI
jgi:transposase